MKKRILLSVGLILLLLAASTVDVMASSFRQQVDRLLPNNSQRFGKLPGGETIYGKFFIRRMYEENKHRPLWGRKSIASLTKALNSLVEDGLNPRDYKFSAIKPYLNAPSRKPSAEVDILLTEAYLRALYNLYYGKTDPERLDPNNNFARNRDGTDRSVLFHAWVKKGRIGAAFDWARPKNDRYTWLKDGLIEYQRIKAVGGWPRIPTGKTIRPGDSDERISLIRKHLTITGDLDTDSGPNTYEISLHDGVMNFQERHYLKVDGIIGPGTLAAMNVPVSKRINQIRVNMERQRWLFPEDSKEYLVVDIAGFTIFWVKGRESIWQEQVQVGKGFTRTPVFKDRVRYIEFNPRKSDDDNAPSRVKFMFPNRHNVFLHDTNRQRQFDKAVQTTGSGCIQLNNPLDLAEMLLSQQGWDRRRVDRAVASGKTTRINLKRPIPILIHYSTAWAIENQVSFKKDIYKRDPKLLAALNGPFVFHTPDLGKKSPTKKPFWTEIKEALSGLGGDMENRNSNKQAPGFLIH